jgi:hypothetical protein
MHRQHVHTVSASWCTKGSDRPPADAEPLTLRLLMAGAQVVPSEQTLDPTKPTAKATFYVTPLAGGWLRGERLEVLRGGRKVQEIPLRCRVVSQRMTAVLLLLVFLVPWFILTYLKNPIAEDVSLVRVGGVPRLQGQTRAETFANRVRDQLPDMPEFVKDVSSDVDAGLKKFPNVFGDVYEVLTRLAQQQPLAFYAAVALLVLTLISWKLHSLKRKRRMGQPIPLGRAEAAGAPQVASKRAEAVAVDD